ncbi:MAG TPA: discoidin domain-containing protein [Myxococcales bacterium]|nr:discoidin domain-containing protein [Myxococcales bacterium]
MSKQVEAGPWRTKIRGGAVLAVLLFAAACGGPEEAQPPPLEALASDSSAVGACSADLARGRPVASSGYWSPNEPGRAVDGNPGTGWESNMSTGAWLQVDLGQVQNVSKVVIAWTWDSGFGSSGSSVVEGSVDGINYTSLFGTTLYAASITSTARSPQTFSFSPVAMRYIRFRATAWNGGWGELDTLEAYAPADLARGQPVTSSGYWSPNDPGKAVDGDPGTIWESNMSTGAFVQVDLGAVQSINKVVLGWSWDTRFGTSADSAVEGSVDGINYTTLFTSTLYASTCSTTCHVPAPYTFAPTSVRYLRFRGTRWNGGWGDVNVFEAYGSCN